MATNGGGLARYREGRFTMVTASDGLPSDLVRSLYQDAMDGSGSGPRDEAWHDSTRADGTRRPEETGRSSRIDTRNGLFDDVIHLFSKTEAHDCG
jgi:hypothetical protein